MITAKKKLVGLSLEQSRIGLKLFFRIKRFAQMQGEGSMKEKLQVAMKAAMKAKEKERLTTIRALLSAIQYAELEGDIDDQTCVALLKTEVKKREEEKEYAQKAGRADQVAVLDIELSTIKEFLPQQLSQAQIEEFVESQVAAGTGASIGDIMGALKSQFPGQFDGKLASQIIKAKLP